MLRTVPDSGANLWTIGKVLKWTQGRFAAAGLSTPRLDAELLLAHSLGRARVALYTGYDQPLQPEELARYRQLIQKRLLGEPVAYLIGEKEFWTLTLKVSGAVLVPRPETETLVEVALRLLSGDVEEKGELSVEYDVEPDEEQAQCQPFPHSRPVLGFRPEDSKSAVFGAKAIGPQRGDGLLIADVGTGSGAVALALKKERPGARVVAVDCSAPALEVAAKNAARLELAIELLPGDLLEPLQKLPPLHLIVSNPPYVPHGDLPALPAEVRAEPRLALDGGPDGLAVIHRLVQGAGAHLQPGGALALEIGAGQADRVIRLFAEAGYTDITVTPDLAGIPRVVSGRLTA